MNYPFIDFARHLELWGEAKTLAKVFPYPSHPREAVQLGNANDLRAIQMRVQHMMNAYGYTDEQLAYCMGRFLMMNGFLQAHADEFTNAGFIMLGDGKTWVAPLKVLRAVHETFRGTPLLHIKSVPPQKVVELANSYPDEWLPSEYQ